MNQIETFVLSGCSAGGLAVYTWADAYQDRLLKLNPSLKFYAMADSGWFSIFKSYKHGYPWYRESMKTLFSIVNEESDFPNKRCVQAHFDDPSLCFHAEVMLASIEVPLFIIQTGYDTWSLDQVLNINCVEFNEEANLNRCTQVQKRIINDYKQNIVDIVSSESKVNVAVWMPACLFHCNRNMGDNENSMKYQVALDGKISSQGYTIAQAWSMKLRDEFELLISSLLSILSTNIFHA